MEAARFMEEDFTDEQAFLEEHAKAGLRFAAF